MLRRYAAQSTRRGLGVVRAAEVLFGSIQKAGNALRSGCLYHQSTTRRERRALDGECWPPREEPFLTDRQPFLTDRQPFLTDRQPFPTDRQPFPIDRQPFPTDRQPFPTDRQPLPTDRQPFPIDRQPFPIDRQPFPISRECRAAGRARAESFIGQVLAGGTGAGDRGAGPKAEFPTIFSGRPSGSSRVKVIYPARHHDL